MRLVTPQAMAAMDRQTIQELGVPGLVLMESAAGAVVAAVLDAHGGAARRDGVVVLAGAGNNGGDGVAIARRLTGLGVPVEVVLLADPARLQGDAATQHALAVRQNVLITVVTRPADLPVDRWRRAGVLVDALLGTGLDRDLQGTMAEAVAALSGPAVVSVDIPSGIDGLTGQVRGVAVTAAITVTFGAAKIGHFTEPGRTHTGQLLVADIGIPVSRFAEPGAVDLLEPKILQPGRLSARDAHKGTFGHLLVVAGAPGTAGAARLCAEAALRAGVGLVTLAIPERLPLDSLARLAPEVMVARVPGTAAGCFDASSRPALDALAASRGAVALGPGLGTEAGTVALVRRLVMDQRAPMVVDADALNCLALAPSPRWGGPRVLTPHPGEMARLIGTSASALRSVRVPVSRDLAARTGAVVVLKGAGTVVAEPDGRVAINPTGNPGMATAGSGDVLTGVIGALLAGGAEAASAAREAVYWHGRAGDLAAAVQGEASLCASDLIEHLGPARRAPGPAHGGAIAVPRGWTPA